MSNTFSFVEMGKFFEEQKASVKCPICQNEDWHVLVREVPPDQVEAVPILLGGVAGMAIGGNITIPLLVLTCARCAFVRTHNLGTFLDWKNAKDQPK